MIFIENLILGIALALPLGPITLEILNRGLKEGWKSSFLAVCGTITAELVYFTIVYLGVYKFAQSFLVRVVLGSLGVLFILYLAASNIADFFIKNKSAENKFKLSPFITAFNITFFNPLNLFMWIGIISLSIAKDPRFITTSGILIGILFSYVLVASVAGFGKKIINDKNKKYVSLIAGIFLIYYSILTIINLFKYFIVN